MRMRVDQAGDDRLPTEIDPPSVCPGQPVDISVGADGDEAIAAYRDGLGNGELAADGDVKSTGSSHIGGSLASALCVPAALKSFAPTGSGVHLEAADAFGVVPH